MSPTQTGLIIVAVIVVMAMIAFTIQTVENQRRERRMRLLLLKDQVRRATHLLHTLPEHYITREIRDVLVRYAQQRWKSILELESSNDNRQKLNELNEFASLPLPVVEHPAGSMTLHTDRSHAERTASLLRELFQFLSELKASGLLSGVHASEVIYQVKEAYTRTRIDVELMDAIEVEAGRGAAAALPRFRTACSKLQSLNQTQQLDRQLYELGTHMEKLQIQVEEERKAREAEQKKRLAEEAAKQDRFKPGGFRH
ncbi:hypothetical protein [Marinobacterium sediminicola]|uniref:Uncharacterized protein n=1 Tax=Marinobacterium sediminicola TaxID=518898 RepID=A0ABY1S167_9GAMM|nr:hypothetical protein [Marinobacterium sediminicola]ULG68362.1 hypothetical protein LN244_11715 [Marinobacterium sediminicola]SMR74759.1 hypothetical protein SAMN04487964_10858 [Marinobacterium sediminicola]